MARPLRIEFPGALYHVTSRGNAQAPIFLSDLDRRSFLDQLSHVIDRDHWLCHAFCLMDNHYHLLIETPDGNLSRGMRQLNGGYTQHFNRQRKRVGHLFQGRYKAILVDKDAYLLELARYIVLNPVRAGMVSSPLDWPWSSYSTTLGKKPKWPFVTTDWLLEQFSNTKRTARTNYQSFVETDATSSPWGHLKNNLFLGDDHFISAVFKHLAKTDSLDEVPREERFANRPSLESLFSKKDALTKKERNQLINQAYSQFRYTQSEISKITNLHYATISRIIKNLKS